MTPKELQNLIILSRTVISQYGLDTYTERALKRFYKAIRQAENEIYAHIRRRGKKMPEWDESRQLALLDEFNRLTVGIRAELVGDVTKIAEEAAVKSAFDMNNIASFDGKVPNWNFVKLHPEQMRAYISTVPIGGRLLNDWVTRSFNIGDKGGIRKEITAGALRGEGYPKLIKRLQQNFDMTKREAVTLSRTYVQEASNEAHKQVYQGNKNIVYAVEWTAAMETGSKKSGRGTCLRCASKDGTRYANSDLGRRRGLPEPIPLPLHPRCLIDPYTMIKIVGGEKPVKEIEIGDEVFTHKGRYRKVTNLMFSELKKVKAITFVVSVNGDKTKYLKVTHDHPIYCNKKWVLADNVKLDDEFSFCSKKNEFKKVRVKRILKREIPYFLQKTKRETTVYNFSVEEDESYVANGFVCHNCRCVYVPVVPTFRELGIDIDEIKPSYRVFYDRGAIKNGEKVWRNIDEGGRAKILETGFRQGDYTDFFWDQNKKYREAMVGPGRMDLLSKTGKVKFSDLTDAEGKLRTIAELRTLL